MRTFHPVIAIILGSFFIFIINRIMEYILDSITIFNGMIGSELIVIFVPVLLILGGFIAAFVTKKNRLLCAFSVGLFIFIINNAINMAYNFNLNIAMGLYVLGALISALFTTLGGFIGIWASKKYVNAWNYKGVALDELGNHDEAIKAYDCALKLDANHVDALFNKGESLGILGKHEEAIKYFDMVLKIDPNDVETWYEKGVSFQKIGNLQEAIESYDKVIEMDPDDSFAYFNKGTIIAKLENYSEAINYFDKALKIDPNDTKTWYEKGVNLKKLGKNQEAVECFDKALQLDIYNKDAKKEKEEILTTIHSKND